MPKERGVFKESKEAAQSLCDAIHSQLQRMIAEGAFHNCSAKLRNSMSDMEKELNSLSIAIDAIEFNIYDT